MYKRYNQEEIDKNMILFEGSLNEVFVKLMIDYSNTILHERAELTLELADHVKSSLQHIRDPYIEDVIKRIDLYTERYKEIKAAYLIKKDLTAV